jgi:hypothetical protein
MDHRGFPERRPLDRTVVLVDRGVRETDGRVVVSSPAAPAAVAVQPPGRGFAHASEAELARILDFYGVAWAYEPDTFPIGWSLEGDVVESFSPDFFLPDVDLYVELTTLKQKLVRKKNRKLRRLRELYPDIRIKLFYARDFRMLLLKFGRMALVDELTGTTGQATPPRSTSLKADPAPAQGEDAVPGPADPAIVEDADQLDGDPLAAGSVPAEARGRRRGRRRRRAGCAATAMPADALAGHGPDPEPA